VADDGEDAASEASEWEARDQAEQAWERREEEEEAGGGVGVLMLFSFLLYYL